MTRFNLQGVEGIHVPVWMVLLVGMEGLRMGSCRGNRDWVLGMLDDRWGSRGFAVFLGQGSRFGRVCWAGLGTLGRMGLVEVKGSPDVLVMLEEVAVCLGSLRRAEGGSGRLGRLVLKAAIRDQVVDRGSLE